MQYRYSILIFCAALSALPLFKTTAKVAVKDFELLEKLSEKKFTSNDPKRAETPPIKVDHKYEIPFGQSAFLLGTFRVYAQTIGNSIKARFLRVNSEGGVQGKMLRLIPIDDGGKPLTTKRNVELLLKKHKIDMFLGNMGTRGVLAVKPLIEQKKIAMLFPWGGDDKLRDPGLSHLINGLGLVEPQIEALIDYIVDELRLEKIAIFHSDGGFGTQNEAFATDALQDKGITPIARGAYNRFTMNIFKIADELMKVDPKIVLCLATSRPTTKLINRFFEMGYYGTQFVGIDSTFLVGEVMKARGAPFKYASYVPDPKLSNYKIVQEYRHDIKRFFPNKEQPNILGLAYYIHATIVAEALKEVEGKITKEKLLTNIENMKNRDLGGFIVDFNKKNRHAYPLQTTILKG